MDIKTLLFEAFFFCESRLLLVKILKTIFKGGEVMETNYNQESEQNNAQFGGTGNNNTIYVPRPIGVFGAIVLSFIICAFLGWILGLPCMILFGNWADYQYKSQVQNNMQMYNIQKSETYKVAFTITTIICSIIKLFIIACYCCTVLEGIF